MSALGGWDARHRLQQLEGRTAPGRHLPEVVRCLTCGAVLGFETDTNGVVSERCR